MMQELVYALNYVLEHMDLIDMEVEKVSVCVICAVRTVKVLVTFCGITPFVQGAVHYV